MRYTMYGLPKYVRVVPVIPIELLSYPRCPVVQCVRHRGDIW